VYKGSGIHTFEWEFAACGAGVQSDDARYLMRDVKLNPDHVIASRENQRNLVVIKEVVSLLNVVRYIVV